jgi:hypothetical protein
MQNTAKAVARRKKRKQMVNRQNAARFLTTAYPAGQRRAIEMDAVTSEARQYIAWTIAR